MKQKTAILVFTILLMVTALILGASSRRNASNKEGRRLVLIGCTNVNGNSMALFDVQRDGRGRILPKEGYFLVGKEHQEPSSGWHCNMGQAITTRRWRKRDRFPVPAEYIPGLSNCAPGSTQLLVPVPTTQSVWRLGLNVLPEEQSLIVRARFRLSLAWDFREPSFLVQPSSYWGTCSTWVESGLITNPPIISESLSNSPPAQQTAPPNGGPAPPLGNSGIIRGPPSVS
jgi:hypothetical protein